MASLPSTPSVPSTTPSHGEDLGWALATVLRAHLDQAAAATGAVPGGPRGYLVLAVAAGGTCANQAEVASRLGLDRTAVTHVVDGLENAGLVRRSPDPEDRRARQVTVTPAGRAVLEDARRQVEEAERALLSSLSADAADALRASLLHVARTVDTVDRAGSVSTACPATEQDPQAC